LRVRMDKANKASASAAGRSPAEADGARSPTNKEARADDGAKDRTDRAEACARDASSRGGALRASGSEGSAFKDVKAGQRGGASTASSGGSNGSSGGALASPPIKSDSPSRDKTKPKSVPAGGGEGGENIKVRDTTAVIPRKRQRECSSDPAEPASKEARKGEAALPSPKLPSELPAPSPAAADRDRDKDHRDRERERERERSRDVERDRAAAVSQADALRRPELSISPRPGRFPDALVSCASACASACSHLTRVGSRMLSSHALLHALPDALISRASVSGCSRLMRPRVRSC
jgi:hypothetical protein